MTSESVPDYLERLLSLCVDMSTMLATQRQNGIRWQP